MSSPPKKSKTKTVAQIERKETQPAVASKKGASKGKESPEKRKRKANFTSYGSFTNKVLKQVHPSLGINRSASEMINRSIDEFVRGLAIRATLLLEISKHTTAKIPALVAAIKLLLPGELAKHAIAEGNKAVSKYATDEAPKTAEKRAGAKRSLRAGLLFPIRRVEKHFKSHLGGHRARISASGAIFLAAVVEYLVAEILELVPRSIALAIYGDAELNLMYSKSHVVLQGGVLPHIEPSLVKTKKSKTSA
jgi:histone H2B